MASIDNDDSLFQFDPCESTPAISSHSESSGSIDVDIGKGKGVSRPIPVPLDGSASKGKGRDIGPPALPALTFDNSIFSSLIDNTPEPSSYASSSSSYGSPPLAAAAIASPSPICIVPTLHRVPSRRRSLSTLSTTNSVKFEAGLRSSTKMSSNLARKLMGRKRSIDLDNIGFKRVTVEEISFPRVAVDGHEFLPHKPSAKGRSYSTPSYPSILDLVSYQELDLCVPAQAARKPAYFDDMLSKELQLQVMSALLDIHEAGHRKIQEQGLWTLHKAVSSASKWVGRERGVCELLKLRAVSKSWEMLVLDGSLWQNIDLHRFPGLPPSVILRMTSIGGAFATCLNISGHVHLSPSNLSDLTENLCMVDPAHSQLTELNLRGCTSLTTRSLHDILSRSPSLRRLNLRGLTMVTNTTCDVLAASCIQLVSLDVGRASNMDSSGIKAIAYAAIGRQEHLLLKELRISGLKYVDDEMMSCLARAAPYLEILDLSYARQLHNSALDAFVSCDDTDGLGVDTIVLTAREAGRDSTDNNRYRRRITRLRHLSLSSCILLTDIACSNLAHSVPHLEFLELAGIGEDLKDEGLIRLLNTTPMIRRIDLEDASDISDALLTALTPSVLDSEPSKLVQEPGHALEYLSISYATRVTEAAMLALIRDCERLKVLETDNTGMRSTVLKEFVRLSRDRSMSDARIVAVDCRGLTEANVKELASSTRPRQGFRNFSARKLKFLDGKDGDLEDLKAGGQDECDEKRVVLKSFYSWQIVDAVAAAREKRRKATSRRRADESSETDNTGGNGISTTRWWSPGGRRSGSASPRVPAITDLNNEGCTIM
ncbi:RNI-like protein [Mycena floridula]|nr:RNI-like protein [Mycena floridula]